MKVNLAKKIIIALVLIISVESELCNVQAGTLSVQETRVESEKDIKTSEYDNNTIMDADYAKKLKKGCVVVNAKIVCDSTYRKKFSKDWKSRSKKTLVQATNMLYDKFNIYYNVKQEVAWDSGKSKNPDKLLDQLYLKYNVDKSKNTDVIVGFTRKRQGSVLGIGYIGAPYGLVCSTAYKTDIQVAQHETGHNYKLLHCNNKKCTMYPYSYQENINKLCKKHKDQWKKNYKLY